MRLIATLLIGFALGAIAQHEKDARIVASILKSDDLDITRNVEQANALLDVYEQQLTADQQQQAKDSIQRNADGVEKP